MKPLENQRNQFDIESHVHYLNGAFMSPMLKRVGEKGVIGLKRKYHPYEISVDDFFEDTEEIRIEFSKLINNPSPDRVVVIPSVSYGISTVVKNIAPAGKKIILAGEQFPSNVYPWLELAKQQGGRLEMINRPDVLENRGKLWNDAIISAIDNQTAVVAISHVHWADGTMFNLKAIREESTKVGALLIIDGTQSIGALPFDLLEIQPDALICAGYKSLLGPYGIGVAYYGPAFDDGAPLEENWINRIDSKDFTGLVNYKESYEKGSLRYEVGEHSNFILVPMMLEAIKQLNEWQPIRIQDYCTSITSGPLAALLVNGFQIEQPDCRSAHLFGIRHPDLDIPRLKQLLEEQYIYISIRGDALRVSPHVYSFEDELFLLNDVLLQTLKRHA